MKLKDVVEVLKKDDLLKSYDEKDLTFSYLSYNSKDIKKNTLFICKGLSFKEEYLKEAIKSGVTSYVSETKYDVDLPCIIVSSIRKAMALLGELFFDDKEKRLIKIGVTGTKGKTTTVGFLKNILEEETTYKTPYMSTIDYYTGKTYGKSHNTTAESVDIYKCIHDAKEINAKYMTMEVSSQATKLDRVYGMHFDVGVFLNIGLDHISPLEHKDFDEYLSCKVAFLKQCDTVIIYHETDCFEKIVSELKDKKIITYGKDPSCDYVVSNIYHDGAHTNFTVLHSGEVKEYKISMLGDFNCLNACAALAVSNLYNIDYSYILKGLIKTEVLGRMNIFKGKTTIIVDYAHNKLSLKALLDTVKEDFKGKNIKLVFGCPGDRGINRREEMGTLAGLFASYTYITAEDPQTKDVLDISNEIAGYIKKYNKPFEIIPDREKAITKAYENSSENDIILVLGKGDETYQIVNGVYVPYKSDVEVAKSLTEDILVK